ncbi:MAG TPA: peptidoglycan DD-metalloendopeptidase family protein, partial [Pararhizobium sp.]|nr:peptidoglycan DD-metalloendopeptidase family protein [Pararhizobium sp.]
KTQMVATLTKIAAERKRLSLLMEEKKRLQSENQSRLAAERQHSEQLAAKADNLNELIASLETRITSARQAAEQAREAEQKRRQQTADELAKARERAANSLPDKNRIAPAYAFSDLKHKLDLPVAGDPIKWFGDDDGTGHPLQGMMISTEPGALVTAPADGWVVYAGPFRSYGDLLILNVGDGYHIVLAGMSKIDVAQGQFVVAGEPVAEMGHTMLAGAAALAIVSSQPTLYIEFRNGGKPVDPRPWWSGNLSGRVSNGT